MDRFLPTSVVVLVMLAVASSAQAVAPPAPPGCGTAVTTSDENTTPTGIPTGPAVVTSTIEVAGAGAYLTDLDLITNITHTFAADLDITLQSPAGTVATITTDNGAGNDNVFAGTTFDDQANPGGQVPYSTNNGVVTDNAYANNQTATPLEPEEALAVFSGENPNGTWTLTISDDLAGDGGTLQSWSLDLTTGACPAPPEATPEPPEATAVPPATTADPAPQPSSGNLQVKADRLSVFDPTAGARCLGASGACHVRALAGGRVIARGTANGRNVPLRLTRPGREMLERRFGGVTAKVVATDATRRARTRTRAILAVERITTPPGSWVAGRAELTAVGRRFVRSLRARMVGVTGLRCDGHVARPEGEPRPELAMALSRARAAVVCGKEAKLVAHGSKNPIASNAGEKGREQNRRVEITVRHTEAKR
jgi:subtilisin-like proprotein convertase family protein